MERLVNKGASVRVVDDFSSGSPDNLMSVVNSIDIVKGDLRDRHLARKVMEDVDVVFHLAALHGGRGFIDTHPADCCSNMVIDGVVFDAASSADVEHVCFASSACVYPTNLQQKGTEFLLHEKLVDPFRPGSAAADGEYGWAKLMGEMTLSAYYTQRGLGSSICRLFTVYGDRENETHAITALIAKAFVEMDPYEIWGNGQQDRNFTYVGDIVRGMMLAAEEISDATPVNLGTSEHIKIQEVAESIFEITGFHPHRIHYNLSKPVGVHSRAADFSRAKRLLGWEPEVTFEEGLKRTIEYYFATHDREAIKRQLASSLTERIAQV